MSRDRTLHIYLGSPMREDAEAGRVNIVNRIRAAVAPSGIGLAFHADTADERGMAAGRGGFHLFHMHEPTGPECLCLRRMYFYPFWGIEATNERWNWAVARAAFDATSIPPDAARGFVRRWRGKIIGDAPSRRDGFVFMPLQGRLGQHRSFQSMSPLAMIEATLAAEPLREIRATLHPKEVYEPDETAALEALGRRFSRFQVVRADARELLSGCDYVVTQNSSVALSGYFAEKPAVLFAGVDFHHIAGSVARDGLEAAFARVKTGPAPDFAAYLYWFFKLNAVNGGAPEAEAQILGRFRARGWQV